MVEQMYFEGSPDTKSKAFIKQHVFLILKSIKFLF